MATFPKATPAASLKYAQQLCATANARADMAALATEIYHVFGGAGGIARECKFQYEQCSEPGKPAKLNMLTEMLRFIGRAAEIDAKQNAGKDEEPLDPEALGPVIADFVKRYGDHVDAATGLEALPDTGGDQPALPEGRAGADPEVDSRQVGDEKPPGLAD